eukprot:TRINITY_DN1956_c0_g7_i1.p1 TRINITY_DN1956_c0_g7~~TRINITY_DN1956_c0_g7_i1.p1  ORF type:complete len:560 (-),score=179.55 TRINITY_DN1956_c0_g7_i1:247-1926(-)
MESDEEVVDELSKLSLSLSLSDGRLVEDDENEPEKHRKLFVGGLSWLTTEEGLQTYFEELGMPVQRVLIMREKTTGRSRGFGFVVLKEPSDVDKAVKTVLTLDGRTVEAKRAIPKHDMDNPAKKIFVGGIPVSLSNAEFRKYFETFGQVLESQVMTDRETGRSRGFGFVTFESEQSAFQVLNTKHTIHGKPVEVKRAEPKKVDQIQQTSSALPALLSQHRGGANGGATSPNFLVHPVPIPAVYFPTAGGYAHAHGFPHPPIFPFYDPTYLLLSSNGTLAYAPQPYFSMQDLVSPSSTSAISMMSQNQSQSIPSSSSSSSVGPSNSTAGQSNVNNQGPNSNGNNPSSNGNPNESLASFVRRISNSKSSPSSSPSTNPLGGGGGGPASQSSSSPNMRSLINSAISSNSSSTDSFDTPWSSPLMRLASEGSSNDSSAFSTTNPADITARNPFTHVRIKPNEVRTERALSASIVPVDFTPDPFGLSAVRAEARKRRGNSQPAIVTKRKGSQSGEVRTTLPLPVGSGSPRHSRVGERNWQSGNTVDSPPGTPTNTPDFLSSEHW